MKKYLVILLLAVSVCSSAQNDSADVFMTRMGNTYLVDGVAMNKKAFMGFLQSRDAVSYDRFRSAYRLSNIGWGLLGGGLALSVASFPVIILGARDAAYSSSPQGLFNGLYDSMLYGCAMLVVGEMATTAGIVCSSVGYVRMHRTADDYIQSHQRMDTGVRIALRSSNDGLGLAIQF